MSRLRDRIRDAVLVLRGYELTYDDYGPEDAIPAGPLRRAACIHTPGDEAAIQGIALGNREAVAFTIKAGEETSQVILSPGHARALAAGILNAADEADGTTPLVFIGSEVDEDEAEEEAEEE